MKKFFTTIMLQAAAISVAASGDFIKLIETYGDNGDYAKADSVYTLATKHTNYQSQPLNTLRLDVTYAIYLNAQGHFEKARHLLSRAMDEVRKMKHTETNKKDLQEIKELHATASYETAFGQWKSRLYIDAKETIKETSVLATEANDSFLIASSYNLEGIIYKRLLMLDKAIASYKKSLEITEKQKDYDLSSTIINNISLLYYEMEETMKAVEISRRQFSYQPTDTLSMDYHTKHLIALCNHGILLKNAGLTANATDTLHLAEKGINEKTPDGVKFLIYTQLVKPERNKYNQKYIDKALPLRNKSKNPYYKANFDYIYAYSLFHNKGLPDQALRHATNAVEFYRKDTLQIMLPKSLVLLSEIESARNNHETSTALMKEAYYREITMRKNKYVKHIAGLEAELNIKGKEIEISKLKERQVAEKSEHQKHIFLLSGLLAMTAILSIIIYIQSKKRKIALRLKQTELEKESTEQYLKGLEDSNDRISKELHDGVCNELLSISLQLNNFSAAIEMRKQLDTMRNDIRSLSHKLASPMFDNSTSLYKMLHIYTDRLKSLSHPQLEAYIEDKVRDAHLPAENISEVYRILQEAVSNIIRHSGADRMYITVTMEESKVGIIIEDNGKGFDTSLSPNEGIGLRSIHKRISNLQGECTIESAPGKGTLLHISFPA